MPLGHLDLNAQGQVKPRRIDKDINAARNAIELGGGIRTVGSNRAAAESIIDGDLATGWSPDPAARAFVALLLGDVS